MSNSTLKTYVAIILDKSGSMDGIRNEARNHFNEQIEALKEESNSPAKVAKNLLKGKKTQGLETKATFVTFNESIDMPIFNEDVNSLNELKPKDYIPGGMTALYDAMGFTIHKFLDEIPDINDPNVAVLFTVITDGQENASSDYSGEEGRKKLKSQIEDLQATNRWTFTYLGANQDVLEEAVKGLSFMANNVQAWVSDPSGTRNATMRQISGTRSYYTARKMGRTSVANFYDVPDADKDDDVSKTDSALTAETTINKKPAVK